MVMRYTNQDRSFIKGVVFQLAIPYTNRFMGQSGSGRSIDFQFPPKIVSDGRKGAWEEGELRGTEPIAVFKTSGAREISIKWTYIVTGGEWNAEKVSNNVKKLRGYFAQLKGEGGGATGTGSSGRGGRAALIVKFKMWRHGDPKHEMTARIKQIDVKHGETIVSDSPLVGGSATIFPLRTDITVDLRLWSKSAAGRTSNDQPYQNLKGLLDVTPPLWY